MLADEKEKAYGWGAHADEPFQFETIEKKVHAIKWFFGLMLIDTERANPACNPRVKLALLALSKFMGRGRKHESPALLLEHIKPMLRTVDTKNVQVAAR